MTRALLLLAAILLAGCASPSIYSWGQYEDQIYESYAKPGKMSPAEQVEKMEADYQKARSRNKPVHPGFHAHLGYLYFQLGKLDEAQQQFQTEKVRFPESSVLMDRMLANLKKQ